VIYLPIIIKLLIALIAFEHLFILWVEMFAWNTKGKKMFIHLPSDLFDKTKGMAANQGLYNGFLSAGLAWSIFIKDISWAYNIAAFFLCCVITAGTYGGATSSKSIFFKQAVPALLVLTALLFTK
jgi:putative membrane protein